MYKLRAALHGTTMSLVILTLVCQPLYDDPDNVRQCGTALTVRQT